MADDVDLQTIKQSERLLLEALGLQKASNHGVCPFCQDKTGFSVHFRTQANSWRYKCHSCGLGGNVFDALAKTESLSFSEAKARCMSALGLKSAYNRNGNGKAPPPAQPLYTSTNGIRQNIEPLTLPSKHAPDIDFKKAEAFIQKSHEYLMNSDDVIERYMRRKRGISEEVAKRFRLGFIQHGRAPMRRKEADGGNYYESTMLPAAWVFPITDREGNLKSVKLHFEEQPVKDGVPIKGKSRPVSGICRNDIWDFNGFWPHPDVQEKKISGINFSRDANWWLSRLPDGPLRAQFQERLINNQTFLYEEVGRKHPDDFGPAENEIVFQYTFNEMQHELKKEILKLEKKDDDPSRSIRNWIVITPGELKALSFISSGLIATSATGGESNLPHPDEFRCFRGRRVALNWDDDSPKVRGQKIICAGPQWVRMMTERLQDAKALEIRSFSWNRATQ